MKKRFFFVLSIFSFFSSQCLQWTCKLTRINWMLISIVLDFLIEFQLIYTCRVSNSCEITMTTRRYCSACRLKKCFKQGMKKELIRSLSAINHASSLAASHKSRHATTSIATVILMNFKDKTKLNNDSRLARLIVS